MLFRFGDANMGSFLIVSKFESLFFNKKNDIYSILLNYKELIFHENMDRIQIKAHKIRLDDVSLSYYIRPANKNNTKTVIFLHGFPFNKNSWKQQLIDLPEDFTGIALDIRGHGLSTSGHGFFSIDVFAKDLKHFIQKLKLSQVVLCGVSMGGYIALHTYGLCPESISGLILCDTHHKADDNTAKKNRFDSIQAVLRYGRRPFAIGFVDKLFVEKTIQEKPEVVELIKSSIRRNSISSICATQLALASRMDSTHILSNISVPTLLIRGDQDKITNKEIMLEMKESITHSTYVEIKEAGHLPNLDNPEEFKAVLLDYLNKLAK